MGESEKYDEMCVILGGCCLWFTPKRLRNQP